MAVAVIFCLTLAAAAAPGTPLLEGPPRDHRGVPVCQYEGPTPAYPTEYCGDGVHIGGRGPCVLHADERGRGRCAHTLRLCPFIAHSSDGARPKPRTGVPGAKKPETLVWPGYDKVEADIRRLSTLLNEKNREVVARYGRNDTPEALAILQPIRADLRAAEAKEAHLLGKDLPNVPNPSGMFARLRIRTDAMGRPNPDDVQRHIDRMVNKGRLTAQDAAKLRFILRHARVLNPASLGASQVAQHVAKNLRRFGIDAPIEDSSLAH